MKLLADVTNHVGPIDNSPILLWQNIFGPNGTTKLEGRTKPYATEQEGRTRHAVHPKAPKLGYGAKSRRVEKFTLQNVVGIAVNWGRARITYERPTRPTVTRNRKFGSF